jgi:hypothetical protein
MALRPERVSYLVETQLARHLRYRCLVLQSVDMMLLGDLSEFASVSACTLGESPHVFKVQDFFDGVGALSCNVVQEQLESMASRRPLIIAGPLHFLDYWTDSTQAVFWRFLAVFQHGPGIIVIDVPRKIGIEGPFRVLGKIPETDIRYLKSRLAETQDRIS